MQKRAIIIHGWEGSPEGCWIPWLKKQLEEQGLEVITPTMPDADNPKMDNWLSHLTKAVGEVSKNDYFIGHSLGCITILRFIESLKQDQKIGGVVLVAGFCSDLGYDELASFFQTKINWEKIKTHCNNFTAIHSDNDEDVSLHYSELFKEKLGAEKIIEHNKGHFSDDAGIKELPVAFNAILKIFR